MDAIDKHSLGALIAPDPNLRHTVPVSPTSVLELLSRSGVGVSGRKVTMVGYGRLVGAPLVQMLLRRGAAVSICSANCGPDSLRELCLSADVIVSAAGVPGLITRDHVRPGAVVINVGTVFDPDGCVLLPDVASDVASVASVMAGCPGGVGPIPVAVLMRAVAANAHRRTGASSTLCLAGADVLCESRVAAELPPGWETCIRHRGSAYVCPEIGAPAAGPVRDTTAVAKTFAVTGFGAAVTFINKVAELAQSFGHHPDVQLTDFRHVRLELSSVSAGGVTVRDLEMARLLDDLAAEFTEAA